jgi:hypothetical protein
MTPSLIAWELVTGLTVFICCVLMLAARQNTAPLAGGNYFLFQNKCQGANPAAACQTEPPRLPGWRFGADESAPAAPNPVPVLARVSP